MARGRYRCKECGYCSWPVARKPLVCDGCNRRDKDFGGHLFVCLGNAPAPDPVPKEEGVIWKCSACLKPFRLLREDFSTPSSCPHCHKPDEDGNLFRCLNYPRRRS
jgi:rubrerythrin